MTTVELDQLLNYIDLKVRAEVHPRDGNRIKVAKAAEKLFAMCNEQAPIAPVESLECWTKAAKVQLAIECGMQWDSENHEATTAVITFFDRIVELTKGN